MLMHTLRVLGGAAVVGPEGPLAGPAVQRARVALLAVLAAAHPRPVARERIMALFWPEADAVRARHLLRNAVYHLRAVLGESAFRRVGDDLALDPAGLTCDLWDFEAALERGDLDGADRAYGGDFLDGFHFNGSHEFDAWAAAERRRHADRHRQALESLARSREDAGDHAGALTYWKRLVALDPPNARFTTGLMRALAAAGDRAGALRQAAAHAALLSAEFGAAPDPAVLALAQRLRAPAGGEGAQASAAPRAHPPAGGPGDLLAGEVIGGATSALAPATEAHASPLRTAEATPRVARRRWRWAGVGVAASVLAVAASVSGGDDRDLHAGSRAATIVLADVTAPTADSALARLVTGVMHLSLERSSPAGVMSPAGVEAALRRLRRGEGERLTSELAQEIARREGGALVVDGALEPRGSGFLLTVRVVSPDSRGPVAIELGVAESPSALPVVAESVASALQPHLERALGTIPARAPAITATTASPEALQMYVDGIRLHNREGDILAAVSRFRDAVAIDSTFASAWRMLYVAHLNLGQGTSPEATEALAKAYTHRGQLEPLERLHVEGTWWSARDRPRAIAAYELLAGRDSTKGLTNLVQLLRGRREFARAESLQRAVIRHNNHAWFAHGNLVEILRLRGKTREADSALAAARARFPAAGGLDYHAVAIACSDRSAADCEQAVQVARSRRDAFSRARATRLLAHYALLRGQLDRAGDLEAEAKAVGGIVGNSVGPLVADARRLLTEARRDLLLLHDVSSALARLDSLSRLAPPERGTTRAATDTVRLLATLYARAGRPDLARGVLGRHETVLPDVRRDPWQRAFLREAWAEVTLADGRWREALALFAAADLLPDGPRDACTACLPLARARVFDRANQADSAIAMYQRYLAEPYFPRLELDAYERAAVLERLGALYEAGGDHASAAAHYERFAQLWREADAPLQARVAAARSRAQALATTVASGRRAR